MPTLDEVLRTLPRAPRPATKTASALPETVSGQVRALAGALRDLPEPQITWASLNAVKTAGFRSPPPAPPAREVPGDDDRPGTPLRKLAHAVRSAEDSRAVRLFEKSALALRAVRGLTLLRERISSP